MFLFDLGRDRLAFDSFDPTPVGFDSNTTLVSVALAEIASDANTKPQLLVILSNCATWLSLGFLLHALYASHSSLKVSKVTALNGVIHSRTR